MAVHERLVAGVFGRYLVNVQHKIGSNPKLIRDFMTENQLTGALVTMNLHVFRRKKKLKSLAGRPGSDKAAVTLCTRDRQVLFACLSRSTKLIFLPTFRSSFNMGVSINSQNTQ